MAGGIHINGPLKITIGLGESIMASNLYVIDCLSLHNIKMTPMIITKLKLKTPLILPKLMENLNTKLKFMKIMTTMPLMNSLGKLKASKSQ